MWTKAPGFLTHPIIEIYRHSNYLQTITNPQLGLLDGGIGLLDGLLDGGIEEKAGGLFIKSLHYSSFSLPNIPLVPSSGPSFPRKRRGPWT